MDTDKLQQLADNLREHKTVADTFVMSDFLMADNFDRFYQELNGEEPCGTTACICGEGVLQNGVSEKKMLTKMDALNIQGKFTNIFDLHYMNFDKLAYKNCWPDTLRQRLEDADSDEERRQVAADRIEHFIEHGE